MDFNDFQLTSRVSRDFTGLYGISMDFREFQWISGNFNRFHGISVRGKLRYNQAYLVYVSSILGILRTSDLSGISHISRNFEGFQYAQLFNI